LRCFFKRSLRYLNGWTPSPFPAEAEQRRLQLTADATRERNRVQKLLEHVNVKIGNVLSDVFGVSGQNMLLALLSGEATPEQIAQLARGQSLGLPGRGDRGMGCRNTAADADAAV
jgi:hypothetical protein